MVLTLDEANTKHDKIRHKCPDHFFYGHFQRVRDNFVYHFKKTLPAFEASLLDFYIEIQTCSLYVLVPAYHGIEIIDVNVFAVSMTTI